MRFVVLTGTSGAGKMTAFLYFGDIGYYAVDNLPPLLLPALAQSCRASGQERVLAVVDARAGSAIRDLPAILDDLAARGDDPEVIFLDASDDVLVRRFKETRRPHPVFREGSGTILEAVQLERQMLDEILTRSDRVIDTSTFTPIDLRETLAAVTGERNGPKLIIVVESFGFKHGLPIDADLVFDVRFLVNPHYVPELKRLKGTAPEVARYVHQDPLTDEFLRRVFDFVEFTLPEYEREGKAYLTIAVGCTGGHHRSVVIAEEIARHLKESGYRAMLFHRDIERESASREYAE